MPHIDHGRQELRLKLVYYGPGLGGKTTNLEYIHGHSRPDRRGKLIALNTESERTLFFDLLPIELGSFRGYRLRTHLVTVPGQIAHDQTRKLVLGGADGVVFVVDSQRERMSDNEASIRNLETNLRQQGDDPATLPLVVQYNKRDLANAAPLPELRSALGVPAGVEELKACAVQGKGVFETFKAIVTQCLTTLGEPRSLPAGRVPSIIPGTRVSMFPGAAPTVAPELPRPARLPDLPDRD